MKNAGYVSVSLQEVPEKLILVSRPLKERFVMNPAGGEIHSASIPDVTIAFPPKTLNTPTKLVLQVGFDFPWKNQSFLTPKLLNNQSDFLKFLWRHDFV